MFFSRKEPCLTTRRYTKKKIYNHICHLHSFAIIDLFFIELGLIMVWHGLTFLSFSIFSLCLRVAARRCSNHLQMEDWAARFILGTGFKTWPSFQLSGSFDHLSSCGAVESQSETPQILQWSKPVSFMQSDHPLANCIDKSMGWFASRDWDILKWKSLWCLVCLSSVYHTLIGTM